MIMIYWVVTVEIANFLIESKYVYVFKYLELTLINYISSVATVPELLLSKEN